MSGGEGTENHHDNNRRSGTIASDGGRGGATALSTSPYQVPPVAVAVATTPAGDLVGKRDSRRSHVRGAGSSNANPSSPLHHNYQTLDLRVERAGGQPWGLVCAKGVSPLDVKQVGPSTPAHKYGFLPGDKVVEICVKRTLLDTSTSAPSSPSFGGDEKETAGFERVISYDSAMQTLKNSLSVILRVQRKVGGGEGSSSRKSGGAKMSTGGSRSTTNKLPSASKLDDASPAVPSQSIELQQEELLPSKREEEEGDQRPQNQNSFTHHATVPPSDVQKSDISRVAATTLMSDTAQGAKESPKGCAEDAAEIKRPEGTAAEEGKKNISTLASDANEDDGETVLLRYDSAVVDACLHHHNQSSVAGPNSQNKGSISSSGGNAFFYAAPTSVAGQADRLKNLFSKANFPFKSISDSERLNLAEKFLLGGGANSGSATTTTSGGSSSNQGLQQREESHLVLEKTISRKDFNSHILRQQQATGGTDSSNKKLLPGADLPFLTAGQVATALWPRSIGGDAAGKNTKQRRHNVRKTYRQSGTGVSDEATTTNDAPAGRQKRGREDA